jgi:hypothetical protein
MKKQKTIPLVMGEYRTYIDTGLIPLDKKNPSKEAIAFMQQFNLEFLFPEIFEKKKRKGKQ